MQNIDKFKNAQNNKLSANVRVVAEPITGLNILLSEESIILRIKYIE